MIIKSNSQTNENESAQRTNYSGSSKKNHIPKQSSRLNKRQIESNGSERSQTNKVELAISQIDHPISRRDLAVIANVPYNCITQYVKNLLQRGEIFELKELGKNSFGNTSTLLISKEFKLLHPEMEVIPSKQNIRSNG